MDTLTLMAQRQPDTEIPAVPRHVARHVVEEDGQVYIPGQELPAVGMSPRRHELLLHGLIAEIAEPTQERG
ncbi:MAG: hypothetical protein M3N98_16070 [Actinomycetota bacterium]|nr:hypothetical protein [Actinomycetota bacterium]